MGGVIATGHQVFNVFVESTDLYVLNGLEWKETHGNREHGNCQRGRGWELGETGGKGLSKEKKKDSGTTDSRVVRA